MDGFIDIHTHHDVLYPHIRAFRLGVEPLLEGEHVGAAVHPWDAGRPDAEKWVERLAELLQTRKIDCVAETGLDFAVAVDRQAQISVFEQQLALAKAFEVPVFIHSVKANDEVCAMLRKFTPLKCVVHGFVGSRVQGARFVELGAYLSVSQRSFRSPKTVEAIVETPLDRLFCESDDEPTDVSAVYALLGRTKGVGVETIKENIAINFKRLYELV